MENHINNAIISSALIKLFIPEFSGFDSNGISAFSGVSTIFVKMSVSKVTTGLSSTSSSVRLLPPQNYVTGHQSCHPVDSLFDLQPRVVKMKY